MTTPASYDPRDGSPRERPFGDLPGEQFLGDAASECAHLAVRPHAEADGYVCDTCRRELTAIEAEEASSEATLRVVRGVLSIDSASLDRTSIQRG